MLIRAIFDLGNKVYLRVHQTFFSLIVEFIKNCKYLLISVRLTQNLLKCLFIVRDMEQFCNFRTPYWLWKSTRAGFSLRVIFLSRTCPPWIVGQGTAAPPPRRARPRRRRPPYWARSLGVRSRKDLDFSASSVRTR